jgi:pyruvate/2-oxoglutarate dehydrogenase complex dihydrolipoamide acyltransferase (E2) component
VPTGPADAILRMYEGREVEEVKLDGMRKTIAARLTEAKQTIPHFYLRRDIRLDALLAFRTQLNGALEARKVKLSVNDFVIKACALALQQVPNANAIWAGDRIVKLKPSDVAVAVAIEGGLFTPVLKDAHLKSLSALSAEMKDLAARARTRSSRRTNTRAAASRSQPRHVRHRQLRRGHQPAAWRDPRGGRRGEEAGGGRERPGRGRHRHVGDAVGRPPA